MTLGLILLAAGASSRMGRPKQLLKLGETTLLGNALAAASKSLCDPIVVVLGAYAEQIRSAQETIDVRAKVSFIVNERWSEGLASSLRAGLDQLLQVRPNIDGAIICTCDQPALTSNILDLLAEKLQTDQALIAASSYCDTVGTPAAFDKTLFPELLGLSGDSGAKSLFKRHSSALSLVDFPGGEKDIDTIAEYQQLNASYAK